MIYYTKASNTHEINNRQLQWAEPTDLKRLVPSPNKSLLNNQLNNLMKNEKLN